MLLSIAFNPLAMTGILTVRVFIVVKYINNNNNYDNSHSLR